MQRHFIRGSGFTVIFADFKISRGVFNRSLRADLVAGNTFGEEML